MPAVKYRELKRMYDLDGPVKTTQNIKESLTEGHLTATDFSIKDLAEALVPDGREWVRSMDPRFDTPLIEAGDGVDITAFANITGQIFYNRLLEKYTIATGPVDELVETIPTKLDGEKIAGVEAIADNATVVPPGMPFPTFGFGESYIETPTTKKRGFIVPVTKEAIFFDQTGKVLSAAGDLGETLGVNKAKRIWDMVIGIASTFATGGKWKYKGTEYDVYNSTTVDYSSYFYVNSATAILADYSDIVVAEKLFAAMTDPATQEPIDVGTERQLLVTPGLMPTARRIVNATEVRETTNTNTLTLSASPIDGSITLMPASSRMRAQLITGGSTASEADAFWGYGNFKKAFAYMENWPIQVKQAPANNQKEFEQDIVVQFRADERGTVAVKDPHYVVLSDGTV